MKKKDRKVLKMFKNSLLMGLALVITFTMINTTNIKSQAAEEDITYQLQTSLSEDQKELKIDLQAYTTKDVVEITAVGNPDGTITEGATTTYISTKNEVLTFVVNYIICEEADGKIKEIPQTREIEYTVDQFSEDEKEVEEAQTQITAFSNAIAEPFAALTTNMNFRNSFYVTNTKDGLYYLADNSLELGYHYNEFFKFLVTGKTYWEGWYAKFAAVSKYQVDFSKDFEVTSMVSSNTSLFADGFTLGFQTDPNMSWTTGGGGSIGAYRNGTDYGARNGVVFEIDYHDNANAWHDTGLGKNHIAIHTTDEYGNESAPIAYQKNITHTNALTAMNAKWIITDKATNTGTLTFNYGSYTLKYTNFKPHEVFGGTVGNANPAYLTYTGVALKDFGSSNKPLQITMTDYAYLNDEVKANSGFITQTQAKALLDQSSLIPYNNASAISKAGDTVTPNVSTASWSDIKNGIEGTYDVTYSYGTASKTVKINVVKDGSIISPEKDFLLYAENASLSESEAQALGSVSDLITVHNGFVTMIDGTTNTPRVAASLWNDIKAGKVGSYDVTFSYGTGTNIVNKSVKLSIVEDKKHEIYASDGFITQTQAKALKATKELIPYNSAYVITNQGDNVEPGTITAAQWSNITSGNVGTYDVRYVYGAGSKQVEKTVKLNVVKDGTVFPPNNSFALYAQDGFIKQSEAKTLIDSTQLIPYNEASVTLANGTSATPLVSVVNWLNIIDGTIGSYDVTYQYGSGSNLKYKTVKLNIIEDDAAIAPDKSFALYADNGTISQTQSAILTDSTQLIPYNNAKVILANGTRAEPRVEATTFSDIVAGVVKTHKVTYSYGALTNIVSKEVNLQLIADKRHEIFASDGFIYETQAKALTHQNDLIPFNSASAVTNTGLTVQPIVTTASWANIVAGVNGSYDITYSYGSGTTQGVKTVILNVVPDGTVFPPDKEFGLYADNGLINVDQAKKLISQNELIPYNSAYVMLSNGTIVNPNVTTLDWLKIASGIEGTYNVTYSYSIASVSMQKTVKITVTKGTTPPGNSFALHARDGFVYEDQAKAFTMQKELIPYNDAFVTLKDGSSVDPSVETMDWSLIKAGTIGSYPILYGYTLGTETMSTTVNLNVIESGTVVSPGQDFAIYAKNGVIQQSDAQALINRNELITYNSAKVTLKDGTIVNPSVAALEWTAIRAGILGTYSISYSYGSGVNLATKTVTIRVVPDGTPSPDGDFILYAHDGFISKDEAKAILSQKDLIPYNKASVIKDDGTNADPSVSTTSYADIKSGKLGVYNVTYRYGFDANIVSKTVKLTVHDGNISPEGNYILNAKDGLISQTEAKTLINQNNLLTINDASVWKKDGTIDIPVVTMLPLNWLALNSGITGSYPVLYSYGSGSDYIQKSVRVTVYADGGEVSPNKDFSLTAKDAVLTQSEAKSLLSEDDLTVYNDALVTYADGNKAIPNTSATEFSAIRSGTVGIYAVTYDYGSGANFTEKTVKLVVVKDGSSISPDRSFAIYAEDVTLNQTQAKALKAEKDFISLANANVVLANGGTAVPTVKVPKWSDLNAGIAGEYPVEFTYSDITVDVTAKVSQEYIVRHLFDYDKNGRVDVLDYAEFIGYMNGSFPLTKEALYLCDADGNGRVDILDLAEFKLYLSDSTLPLVEVHIPI